MNAGPLSYPMLVGNPNLGTIFLSRHQATFDDISVWLGKASTHPKKVHTMTSKELSFQWSPPPCVQRAVCLSAETLGVSVCAERQRWPVSRQYSSEILSCIGKRGGEPRNIFELALPVYHGLDGSLGVFGLPGRVPAPPVPIICHLAILTILFQSRWPLLLWLVGFGLQCILESLALAQVDPPTWELS